MKPDLKNTPLTPEEFEALPQAITSLEFWEPVKHGRSAMFIDASNSWSEPFKVTEDTSQRVIGYIGRNTGIRLCVACSDLIEEEK